MVKKEKKKLKKKENSIESTSIVVNNEGENEEIDDAKQEESLFTKHEIKRIPETPAIAAAQKHNKKDKTKKPKNKRMLILFRSAEQMDKVFPEWMHKNFIDEKYVPYVFCLNR
uniref:Uncharacterized protein n=1 Tax=Panagrolaimus davidi TaxID=227884 RepID=A0A914P658_9BILA